MPADPTNPDGSTVLSDPDRLDGEWLRRPGPNATGRLDRLAARRHDPRVVAAILVVVAGLAAFAWLWLGAPHGAPQRTPDESVLRRADRGARTASAGAGGRELVVQVAGAVGTPGLVRLRDGERVADAIAAAGGARPDADLDAVNLAARVADGERVVVPVRGALPAGSPPASGGAGGARSSGPVHLNSASAAELETLPGIGPSLAAAIIRSREEAGGFRSVQDLERVRGIGAGRMADLAPLVAL